MRAGTLAGTSWRVSVTSASPDSVSVWRTSATSCELKRRAHRSPGSTRPTASQALAFRRSISTCRGMLGGRKRLADLRREDARAAPDSITHYRLSCRTTRRSAATAEETGRFTEPVANCHQAALGREASGARAGGVSHRQRYTATKVPRRPASSIATALAGRRHGGLGVSSFGKSTVHGRTLDTGAVSRRGQSRRPSRQPRYRPTAEERMIREWYCS